MTPLEILQKAEREFGPNYTEDGYTETSIIPVIDVLRAAARQMDAQDLIIGMVWTRRDECGFGGDSELMAMKRIRKDGMAGYDYWSIPVPFNSDTDLADVVQLIECARDGYSPDGFVAEMPRAYNYIW